MMAQERHVNEARSGDGAPVAERSAVPRRRSRASRRRLRRAPPVSTDHAESAAVEEAVVEDSRRAALHAAVEALPRHEREMMRALLAKPALTYDELGVALGIPRGSIGPRRGRSLARLRRDPHLARAVGPAGA